MSKTNFIKIVLCAFSVTLLLFLGSICALITSIITGKVFYGYMVATVEISLIIYGNY